MGPENSTTGNRQVNQDAMGFRLRAPQLRQVTDPSFGRRRLGKRAEAMKARPSFALNPPVGKERLPLAVVGPVVPDLISEVAAEEASDLFRTWVLAVEEPSGGKVVGLPVE